MTYRFFVVVQGQRVYVGGPVGLVVHTTGDGLRPIHRALVDGPDETLRPLRALDCAGTPAAVPRDAPVWVEFTPRALHHTMQIRPGQPAQTEFVPPLLPGL